MDRFVMRASPAFSSHKVPSKPAPNGGGTNKASQPSQPQSAAASLARPRTPVTPSARDAQLMRIFQSDTGAAAGAGRAVSPLALSALNPAAGSGLGRCNSGANVFTFGGGGGGGGSASKVTGDGDVCRRGMLPAKLPTFTAAALSEMQAEQAEEQQENRRLNIVPVKLPQRLQSLQQVAINSNVLGASPTARIGVTTASASATVRAAQQRCEPPARYLDVSHTEQDIRTADERAAALLPPPSTIQEVMRNVCVYVEVRSGSDNRSQGVKTIIAELGAAVNDRLLRNTTHVIFKDGLLSTYQKAKAWGIPVVSILWIEACRRQVCLLDPARYAISNVDRYEQPEMYEKMRKQKSMQPYAEENRRRVVKPAATKATSAAGSAAAAAAPAPKPIPVPRKPKDNLPSIFGDFVKTMQANGTDSLMPKNSKLMDIIRNSPLTVGVRQAAATTDTSPRRLYRSASTNESASTSALLSLNHSQADAADAAVEATPTRRLSRRLSMQNLSTPPAKEPLPASAAAATPSTASRSRRKTCVFEAVCEEADADTEQVDMEVTDINFPVAKATPRSRRKTIVPKAVEEVDKRAAPLLNSVLRRQTMYTPQSMQETICGETEQQQLPPSQESATKAKTAVATSSAARRRTMFVPGQGAESTVRRLERLMSDEGSVSGSASSGDFLDATGNTTPQPRTPIASSTNLYTSTDHAVLTPIAGTPETPVFGAVPAATILAEYSRTVGQTPQFSSTRTPASQRRRTMFDMSMEIIDQRLQSINRQAAAAVVSARKTGAAGSVLNRSMSESDLAVAGDDGGGARMQSAESCDVSMLGNHNAVVEPPPVAEKPKKRKLFAPSALSNFGSFSEAGDAAAAATEAELAHSSQQQQVAFVQQLLSKVQPKRRRDVDGGASSAMELATGAGNGDGAANGTPSKRAKVVADAVEPAVRKPVATKRVRALASGANRRRTTLDFALPREKIAAEQKQGVEQGQKQQQQMPALGGVLVSTNMHQEQIAQVKETVRRLGAFQLDANVTDRCTHLVSLEPLRTVNMLRALIRGLWILNYQWVLDSAAAGRWLPEDAYEVRDFSDAVSICRSERQAFGASYRCNIFADLGPMHIVAENCACPQLRELVLACAGRLTSRLQDAKYVISDTAVPVGGGRDSGQQPNEPTALCLRSTWILDSIMRAKVRQVHAYVLKC